jgi:hypothetical protein
MTTTDTPGANGTTKPSVSKLNLLIGVSIYAFSVWAIVQAWGDPFPLRAAACGVAFSFIAHTLPLLNRLPRWAAIVTAWMVLALTIPNSFYDGMLLGLYWLIAAGIPVVFVAFFVLAFLGRRGDPDDGLESPDRIIVGLSGYAGAGKDTAADALIEKGFTRVSFADKLREVALAINPLVPVVVPGIAGAEDRHTYMRLDNYVDLHGWTEAKKNLEVRGLLQRLGTEAGRKILGENVWVDAVMNDLPEGNLVFTDMRFPNEYDAIVNAGGIAVRIQRPGVTAVNAHPSETALDDHLFHAVIANSATPEHLGVLLLRFMQAHTGDLI